MFVKEKVQPIKKVVPKNTTFKNGSKFKTSQESVATGDTSKPEPKQDA